MIDPSQMTKDQLKALALKQRIGEITSDYEDKIADIRADFTQQYNALQDVLREQEKEIETLQKLGKSNEAEKEEGDKPAKSAK